MSGISSITSGTSGTSSASSTAGLSSVGASLLTSGAAPNAVPTTTASSASSGLSSVQTESNTLNQQDTAELLYASFLSPEAGLENADAVLNQAATLLDSGSYASSQSSATASTTSGSSSSTTTTADPLDSLPSVSSILAASDSEAEQTLTAYANAPVGSSIIDFQA